MAKNIGATDKVVRLVAGTVLIALPFISGFSVFNSTAATIAAVCVGLVLVVTALFNFCPIYRLLGIQTCRV